MSDSFSGGWLSGVRKEISPFYNDRPDVPVDMLVIHNISLPCGQYGTPFIFDLFNGCLDCSAHESFSDLAGMQVSAHFFIDRCGCVTQFVSTDKRAWHAGVSEFNGRKNINDCSIGIELEGTDDTPFTDAQYASLADLTNRLMQEYPISYGNIVGHSDVAPGRKTDPGKYFDWDRYFLELGAGT